MRVSFVSLAVALPVLSLTTVALADFVPGAALVAPALPGDTQYDGWIGLTSTNYAGYGGFPGSAAWPAPIGSNRTAANTFNAAEPGDAGVIKTSNGTGGGPYPAGGSIYFGGFSADVNNFGGTLAVSDAAPVAGLSNVVFQVQIAEAWTFDFYNGVLPTLSYNGGTQQLAATASLITDQFFNGTIEMPSGPEDIFINTYLLQWDLSGVSATVSDFSISFSGVQHAQLYGMQLDQSNVYSPVPAPGALALAGLGALAAARRRRR